MGIFSETIAFEVLGASVRVGEGAVGEIGPCFKSVGAKTIGVVTDVGVIRAGVTHPILKSLEASGLSYVIFDKVEANPSDRTVMEGVAHFRESRCEAILGIGGGSPLDAAKAIQVMASHPGEIQEYFGLEGASRMDRPRPYLIAVPTTSGTGSEVSRGAIITNLRTKTKAIMRTGPSNLAIIDPEMTLTLPPRLTAATGMDALSHHIEAYVSNRFHPICTSLAMEGVRLIGRSLRRAVARGSDLEARMDMAVASMMGALAFQKGLGAAHSLAHQLSPEANVQHGVANSILLPHVMQFNLDYATQRFAEIARALGESVDSLNLEEAAERSCGAVRRLSEEIGMPQRLREVGVREDQIAVMAEKAMADWSHPTNPRPCALRDMLALYRAAY